MSQLDNKQAVIDGKQTKTMRPVVLESPYGAKQPDGSLDVAQLRKNVLYAHYCIRDCVLNHHESPYASHLMLTGALNDLNEGERQFGIDAGLQFAGLGLKRVYYIDFGYSKGMSYSYASSTADNRAERKLPMDLLGQMANAAELLEEAEWNPNAINEVIRIAKFGRKN